MNVLFQNVDREKIEQVKVRGGAEDCRLSNNPFRSDLIKSFVRRLPGEG